MIVALVAVLGLVSWTVLFALLLWRAAARVAEAEQRVADADARRFRALELLNEEQAARERELREHQAQLFAIQTTALRMTRMYRAALAKATGQTFGDPPTKMPKRVM